MSDAVALLHAVVAADARALARALHPRATLHRADGSVVTGRESVIAALCAEAGGARYEVLGVEGESLVVALTLEGVPGALRFALRGEVAQGRLIAVRVSA